MEEVSKSVDVQEVEQRREASPEHARMAQQRSVPAIYIVDGSLRLVSYRQDPHERRRDCTIEATTQRLPQLIERTVKALLDCRRTGDDRHAVHSAAPNASLLVRLVPLDGAEEGLYAVLVERFQTRRTLKALAERYALSKREHEALALVVQGAKNTEIASRLQIAESTAVFHVKRLMAKTGARNRAELVAKVVG